MTTDRLREGVGIWRGRRSRYQSSGCWRRPNKQRYSRCSAAPAITLLPCGCNAVSSTWERSTEFNGAEIARATAQMQSNRSVYNKGGTLDPVRGGRITTAVTDDARIGFMDDERLTPIDPGGTPSWKSGNDLRFLASETDNAPVSEPLRLEA